MTEDTEAARIPVDAAAAPAASMVELDDTTIMAVAGGINPQPLPPRHDPRLD